MGLRVFLVDDREVVRNGLRALLEADGDIEVVGEAGTAEEAVRGMALQSEAVVKHLDGKPPKKVIYVPGKLVNIVA